LCCTYSQKQPIYTVDVQTPTENQLLQTKLNEIDESCKQAKAIVIGNLKL
jgi:hypothetical protein